MRTEKEIFNLIINAAKDDDILRACIMTGSRTNPDAPKDKYQDYDIVYIVRKKTDISPYFNNIEWLEKHFGKPIIMQLPQSMSAEICPPDDDGHFAALMIFDDGVRIDLNIADNYIDDGEHTVILFDKDDDFQSMNPNDKHWHVKPPTTKVFQDCCNEFWWCLNNVAKGIARDELPFAMNMYNTIVREMHDKMIEWYIGTENDFAVSAGKNGKYFKRYLTPEMYEKYAATYSDSDYNHFWKAVFTACELFHYTAVKVAEYFGVEYNQDEENAMISYLKGVESVTTT